MRRLSQMPGWIILLACTFLSAGTLYAQTAAGNIEVVESYRRARAATMQADATEASVNQVSALLSDSIVYEHPRVGARLVGRATLVAGIRGFRGKSRDARIEVLRQIAGPGVVAAEERVSFEAMEGGGWRETTRTQLSVYEITGGRISRLTEYW